MAENRAHPVTPPGGVWRSVWAVFAGLLANFVLAMGTDAALHAAGVYPPWLEPMAEHLWGLALAYRVVFAIVGGYVTARLAPSRPMAHVMALLGIGTLLGAVGVAMHWNKGPEFGPQWFNLGIIATGIPCTWLGGWLRTKARGSAPRTS